jgi:hypothetical protein
MAVAMFGFMRTTVLADCAYCERETDHLICEDCDETGRVCEHLECTVCGTRFPDPGPS